MLLTPAQIKPQSFESRWNCSFFFFLTKANVSHVDVGTWALCCFFLVLNLSEGADRVGGQLRGDKECPFGGVTSSGRVWRKVPESNARRVFPSLAFRQSPPHSAIVYGYAIEGVLHVPYLCASAQGPYQASSVR